MIGIKNYKVPIALDMSLESGVGNKAKSNKTDNSQNAKDKEIMVVDTDKGEEEK